MMETKSKFYRWHAIQTLQERTSQSKLWAIGIFLTMAFGFALSSILLINSTRYTQINLLSVEKQPLLIPMFANGILVSLYLSMLASISASRELDKGTLESLLYGPVDESSYVFGTFLAHTKVFLITLMAAFIWANLCVWILNLSFNLNVLGILLASFLMAAELIAFGLFSAFLGGKTRNALIFFILVILLLGGIQIGDAIISGLVQLPTTTVSDPVLILRNILASINGFFRWISPFSLSLKAMQAVIDQQLNEFLLNNIILLFESVFLLTGAILLLKKKGVRGIV